MMGRPFDRAVARRFALSGLAGTILLVLLAPADASSDIVGKWKTIDDETGEPRAIVEISRRDGEYVGTVREIFLRPGEPPNPTCRDCPGEKEGKEIVGMEILWSLEKKRKENRWGGGRILDPENGKVYKCKIKRKDGTLRVRGFVGIPLFGRTQTWHRVSPSKD